MDRINTASKAVDLFGVGKHGWKNRNVATGVEPTDFNAEWCNGVQEEELAIIEGAGIVPDAAVRTQVRQAIKRLFGGNVTTVNFAASPFQLTADHAGLVLVDAAAGNVVINLPAANVLVGLPYTFRRTDTTANTVTVNRAGADTIDEGGTSFALGSKAVQGVRSNGVAAWSTVTQRAAAAQKFTASGTFTVPSGVSIVYISMSGGGGGGGGGASAGRGGGGGGAHAVLKEPVVVTSGAAIAVTIGANGLGGASNISGTAGGTSSFGAFISTPGGTGGFEGSAGAGGDAGGSGGGYGQLGSLGGSGAGSVFGAVTHTPLGAAGYRAGGHGAGGSGGNTGQPGGNGSAGFVLVEW